MTDSGKQKTNSGTESEDDKEFALIESHDCLGVEEISPESCRKLRVISGDLFKGRPVKEETLENFGESPKKEE